MSRPFAAARRALRERRSLRLPRVRCPAQSAGHPRRAAAAARRGRPDLRRALRLAVRPLPGDYDLPHLQACHRALFEGIYTWAGELRTVRIAKGDTFCLPQHIESAAADIFGRLARERRLTDLAREDFIDRLAGYLGDVNALHPFREGNGRAQRVLFSELASDAGYAMHWQRVDLARNLAASIARCAATSARCASFSATSSRRSSAPLPRHCRPFRHIML